MERERTDGENLGIDNHPWFSSCQFHLSIYYAGFGDSGGSILPDGTILGVNSFVNNSNCDGVTHAQKIDIADISDWINGYLP